MPIEPSSQIREDGILAVGSHTLDDELPARHAHGQRAAVSQELLVPEEQSLDRRLRRSVVGRIDRELVQDDRELDQKLRELTRERGAHAGSGSRRCC